MAADTGCAKTDGTRAAFLDTVVGLGVRLGVVAAVVESCNEDLGLEAANVAAPFAILWLCSAYEHNVVLSNPNGHNRFANRTIL